MSILHGVRLLRMMEFNKEVNHLHTVLFNFANLFSTILFIHFKWLLVLTSYLETAPTNA